MHASNEQFDAAIEKLGTAFLNAYPRKGAQLISQLTPEEAARLLHEQPLYIVVKLWKYIPPGSANSLFKVMALPLSINLLRQLDANVAVSMLATLDDSKRSVLLGELETQHPDLASELKELLIYPPNTAARMMDRSIQAFYADTSVHETLSQLKKLKSKIADVLYVLGPDQALIGELTLNQLLASSGNQTLGTLAAPIKGKLDVMDHKDTVVELFEGLRARALPVLDAQKQLVGQIRFFDVYQSTKEELVSDMQTMVGASKDEKALSSSWFAVKKRLPWLQINLLTAFAAAAVVGAFEGLIAQVTALAILLPVAAGQSGNAGAQALAVTMRGLTLREISTRQWYQVMLKEMLTGLLNGLAIALTCAIGVYIWSQSVGLALVIALALICSLVIAGSAGAIVPIALKKFGLDPAQSSSIVLTTITDIAGFMSFLGIALLLSDMLPVG
ncbi:magnesium transporter [Pseudoalteromonas rubra]|uniref:Magnesium transporter n=1 Tax=Pseudoalteromonas rubra TaxID=43658 RepID=A0A5S3WNE1_9GAMM|nr:magnesium transporter [Pseudoalteromonas rubra]TMP29535.1 magnesium transporter [Pseudoalteromonas rubra]TMP35129.1 magnesium transporter [Pseudoalteromonas rubra]